MNNVALIFLIATTFVCSLFAWSLALINSKRINKLEKKVNELDGQVNELIDACNNNTKHIDELLLASTDTMKIVAEHIDEIKELKKRR